MADERRVCSRCLDRGVLRDWLETVGLEGDCDFDDQHISELGMTVDELAEAADRWFRENYQPGADTIDVDPDSDRVYHGTEGQPYEDIFAEELGSSEDVLRAVIDALPDVSHRDIMDGAEPYYSDAHNFEAIEVA